MTLAFSSKHPYVPNPNKSHQATRWIASLSDGTTVFEDITPYEESAWLRLRKYVEIHKLKITNLRLEAYSRRVLLIPYKDDEDRPQINGYFYSKFSGKLFTAQGTFENLACGIGYLKGREIIITWVMDDGTIKQEIRPYTENNLALIINDMP